MKLSYKTVVIVNPRSANGATGRRWPAIEKTLESEFQETLDVVFTESPLHATELTRVHLEKGYEMVVALGGDGLINEVVNGFFESDQNLFPHAVMGIISLGTASDFVRTMGWGRGLPGGARRLGGIRTHTIDVGKASFQNFEDEREARYFLNVADFGSGGAVVERVNRTTKAFGGTISFLWGILSTLPRYKNKEIRFTIDGGLEKRRIMNNLIIANGQFYGGGIRSAPDAAVDDGLFQFVTIGDLTFPEVVWNLPRFRSGAYLTHPKVDSYVGRRLSAGCDEPVLVELDGELVGTLPAEFEILPRTLHVKVPDLTEP